MTTSKGARNVSYQGIDFVARLEKFVPEAYQDEAGKWTIGYGETENVHPADTITEPQARNRLETKLTRIASQILASVTVPLAQFQLDALCAFVYNVGLDAFRRSDLLRLLNLGCYSSIPHQLVRWKWVTKGHEKVESEGLLMRRLKESEFWEGPA